VVTVGVPVTFTGNTLKTNITITPSAFLVHTATGHPLVNMIEEATANDGVAVQFTLPHTDQAGFQDEAGNAYQNWYYTATIQYQSGKVTKPAFTKVFQLAVGQTTVDLDLLPSGSPAMPYTAPVATVTSVNGQNGAITVAESTDAGVAAFVQGSGPTATALNATFVPKWKPNTAYLAGDAVLSPVGDVVTAIANFTSGASYNAANWNVSATYVPVATDQTITGSKTFNSQKGTRISTWLGIGAGVGSARNPFYMNSIVDGSAITNTLASGGGDDYVGMQTNIKFDGGFAALKTTVTGSMTAGSNVLTLSSGTFTSPVIVGYTAYVPGAGVGGGLPVKSKITSITDTTHAVLATNASTTVTNVQVILTLAADHNYAFMANDFYTTGTAAGALSGIDNVFGRLTELHIYTPNAVIGSLKATSSELDIEASATGSTVSQAVAHEISAIRNDAGAAITNAYGLLIHGTAPANTTNAYALYIDGGGKTKFTGPTTLAGTAAADTPLTLQAPLAPTGKLMQGYDVTLTNRVFHIDTNGAIGSNSFLTAFEGLGSQMTFGQMPGGYAGVQFGNSNQVYIKKVSNNVIGLDSATQGFATGYGTTAQRPANPVNGTIFIDSTLGKPVYYIAGAWKDATGVAA
jgi:hypothetical protein